MADIYARNKLLLGEENFSRLRGKTVAVFGLGGVGGTSAIALARSGIGNLILVDFDVVADSNLNRQILFKAEDVGPPKTEVARKILLEVDSTLNIAIINEKVDEGFFKKHPLSCDVLIDAIDFVPGKLEIASYCQNMGTDLLMSLGMANRLDPTKVTITTLDNTSGDPLARKIRQTYRKNGFDLSKIKVAFSSETPIVRGRVPASMMMVPSAAGLALAHQAIVDCLG